MFTKLKDIMIEAAKSSGDILKEYFKSGKFDIVQKSMNADLVTDVDKKAQNVIVDILSNAFPEIPIVAEEKDNPETETAFYIDPLDGTLNFTHKFPFFAVSIGYWENRTPKVGVVYNPITREMYWAIEAMGAYLNDKKISVSSTTTLRKSLLVTGWPYDRSTISSVIESVKNALDNAQEIRSLGSAALECCYVASGIFDGYWEWGLSPWDLAAGVLIAKEAGAVVTSLAGSEFSLERGDILCAAPLIHKDLLNTLRWNT